MTFSKWKKFERLYVSHTRIKKDFVRLFTTTYNLKKYLQILPLPKKNFFIRATVNDSYKR